MRRLSYAVLLLLACGCASRPGDVDPAAELPKVRAVVNQMAAVFENEDLALFSRIMARDADLVAFGTDASERWVGYAALSAALQRRFDSFADTKLSVRDQVIDVSGAGDAAWFSQVVDWDTNASGQPVQLQGTRWTGVLERRGAEWVCVQFHVSVPVAGQAAPY